MKREEFIKQIEKNIEDMSLENAKQVIIQLGSKIPSSLFETMMCIIKNLNGNIEEYDIDILKSEIYSDFKEIENGNIYFKCYSYGTGTYSYYDEDLAYSYFPTAELNKILNKTYDFIVKAVLHKKYADAIEIFDLFLYTDYSCDEVGNPDYDNSDEVYDTFERSIDDVKESLDFDFNKLLLYAIYSVIIGNYSNKKEKIYEYTKHGKINIENVKTIGIEEIKNFDKFYQEWLEFIDNKK